MNPEAANWLASAEYDLDTARRLLRSGRHIYVIFMCHLAVEKTLKALLAAEGTPPPRIHSLERLASLAGATFDQHLADFIADLTDASVVTRYHEDLSRMLAKYPRSVARRYLERSEEVIACLRADPRLQP